MNELLGLLVVIPPITVVLTLYGFLRLDVKDHVGTSRYRPGIFLKKRPEFLGDVHVIAEKISFLVGWDAKYEHEMLWIDVIGAEPPGAAVNSFSTNQFSSCARNARNLPTKQKCKHVGLTPELSRAAARPQ